MSTLKQANYFMSGRNLGTLVVANPRMLDTFIRKHL